MHEKIKNLLGDIELNEGASSGLLKSVELELGISFPDDYVEFMQDSNGIEGAIGEDLYIVIWPIENIVSYNKKYAVDEFAPGLIIFGSDGGNVAYAFDKREEAMPIVEIPFIGMDLGEVKRCCDFFNDLFIYAARQ